MVRRRILTDKSWRSTLLFLIAITVVQLLELSQAARSRVPLNGMANEVELEGRSLQKQCEFIEQVQAEFCCDPSKTKECDTERAWFIDDQQAKLDNARNAESAQDMNDTVNAIVQYGSIGLAAVCCPICIAVAICKCVIKRREKKEREAEIKALKEAQKNQAIAVTGGYALSSSCSSVGSDDDEEQRAIRREQRRLANEQYNQKIYDANQLNLISMAQMMNQQRQLPPGSRDPYSAEQQFDQNYSNSRPSSSDSRYSSSEVSADDGIGGPPNSKPQQMARNSAAVAGERPTPGSVGQAAGKIIQGSDNVDNASSFGGHSAVTNMRTHATHGDLSGMQAENDEYGHNSQSMRKAHDSNDASQYMATNMSLKSNDGLISRHYETAKGNAIALDQMQSRDRQRSLAGSLSNDGNQPSQKPALTIEGEDGDLTRDDEIKQIRDFLNGESNDMALPSGQPSNAQLAAQKPPQQSQGQDKSRNSGTVKIFPSSTTNTSANQNNQEANQASIGGKSVKSPLQDSENDIL